MPGSDLVSVIRAVIEWAALGIEILGAAVIVAGVLRVVITRGAVRYLYELDRPGAYESYKHQMCSWDWNFSWRGMWSERWPWTQP